MIRHGIERWVGHPEYAFRDLAVLACAAAVLFSVAWSFLNYHHQRPVRRGQRSIVDTLTMMIFYAGYSCLLARDVGAVPAPGRALELTAIFLGTLVVGFGCVVNVMARHQLGATWSNQIVIYDGHQLLTRGWFRFVRHPLYASLIWMFLGASLAFLNCAALLASLLVFVPAMGYRARQEERLLLANFPEYHQYRRCTGAFFPRLSGAYCQPL